MPYRRTNAGDQCLCPQFLRSSRGIFGNCLLCAMGDVIYTVLRPNAWLCFLKMRSIFNNPRNVQVTSVLPIHLRTVQVLVKRITNVQKSCHKAQIVPPRLSFSRSPVIPKHWNQLQLPTIYPLDESPWWWNWGHATPIQSSTSWSLICDSRFAPLTAEFHLWWALLWPHLNGEVTSLYCN